MKTYNFHSDPGHGWLEVPRADLVNLGILFKISRYSYIKNDICFLEEDCDVPRFLHAMKEQNIEYKINELDSLNREHFIRNCNHFPDWKKELEKFSLPILD